MAYHQGVIFKKFMENSMFTSVVTNLKIRKSIINFKIGIVQFIHDYAKMEKSSISLKFLKNNLRIIKEVLQRTFMIVSIIFLRFLVVTVSGLY